MRRKRKFDNTYVVSDREARIMKALFDYCKLAKVGLFVSGESIVLASEYCGGRASIRFADSKGIVLDTPAGSIKLEPEDIEANANPKQ